MGLPDWASGTSGDLKDVLEAREELRKVISRYEGELTELERTVFSHWMDGRTPLQIAAETGQGTSTVRSTLRNARRKLARQLGKLHVVNAEKSE